MSTTSKVSIEGLSGCLNFCSIGTLRGTLLPGSFELVVGVGRQFTLGVTSGLFDGGIIGATGVVPTMNNVINNAIGNIAVFLLNGTVLAFVSR